MAELIQKQDTLNEGREKINAAITDAEQAKVTADGADSKATQALANSESTQTQLDTIVINGDSSVEAAQARVDEKGVGHTTLKDRIDDGFTKVTSQLNESTIQTSGYGVLFTGIDSFGTYGDLRVAARPSPNMTVNVYPGTAYMPNGDVFTFNNPTVLNAPPKQNGIRKDIVFVSNEGALTYLEGGTVAPSFPSGSLPLAEVTIVTNAIYGRDIVDKRILKFSNTQLRNEILKFKYPYNSDGAITNALNVGLTYVDKANFVYGNERTLFNDVPATPNTSGFYEIDCSSFVLACIQGVTFENSKYQNEKNYYSANILEFPEYAKSPFDNRMLANDLAKFAYENGWLFKPNQNWSNVRVGDLIFWSNSPQQHFFRGIGHVQIVSRIDQNGNITVYHAYEGNSAGQVIEERTYTTTQLINLKAFNVARYPLGENSMVLDYINDEPETVFTQTGYNIRTYNLKRKLEENKIYTAFIKAYFVDNNAYPWIRSFDEVNIYSMGAGVEKRPDGWYKATFRIRQNILNSENNQRIRLSAVNNSNGGTVERFYLYEGYVSNPPQYRLVTDSSD